MDVFSAIDCPKCGAPVHTRGATIGYCRYCDNPVILEQRTSNESSWQVDRVPPSVLSEIRSLLNHGQAEIAVSLYMQRTNRSRADAETAIHSIGRGAELTVRKFAEPIHFACFLIGMPIFIAGLVFGIVTGVVEITLLAFFIGLPVGMFGIGRIVFSLKHLRSDESTARVLGSTFLTRLGSGENCYRLWVEVGSPTGSQMRGETIACVPRQLHAAPWSDLDVITRYFPDQPDSIVVRLIQPRECAGPAPRTDRPK